MQIQDRGNLGPETLEGMTWGLADEATKNPREGIPGRVQFVPRRTTRNSS